MKPKTGTRCQIVYNKRRYKATWWYNKFITLNYLCVAMGDVEHWEAVKDQPLLKGGVWDE